MGGRREKIEMTKPAATPPGLRRPWVWVQPKDRAELLQRLLDARDLRVHERERENLCSVAHGEIRTLGYELQNAETIAEVANEQRQTAERKLASMKAALDRCNDARVKAEHLAAGRLDTISNLSQSLKNASSGDGSYRP